MKKLFEILVKPAMGILFSVGMVVFIGIFLFITVCDTMAKPVIPGKSGSGKGGGKIENKLD